ncbi:MAG: hypothetical protein KDK74_16835, partial [Cephaloticoccus sp.]|nr:hypothetical protein [Cephaloticoccus sp.]
PTRHSEQVCIGRKSYRSPANAASGRGGAGQAEILAGQGAAWNLKDFEIAIASVIIPAAVSMSVT